MPSVCRLQHREKREGHSRAESIAQKRSFAEFCYTNTHLVAS